MAYVKSDAPGADEWCVLVDRINDVFNYSLPHAAAHALAAQCPGSKVVVFPWPLDAPNKTPDPAQFYACVWLAKPGENALGDASDFLCFSGVCRATDWADSEGFSLHEAVVVDAMPPRNEGEQSLHRMIVRTAQSLPWMPAFSTLHADALPQLMVHEIVTGFEDTISQLTSARDWGTVLDRAHRADHQFVSPSGWSCSPLWADMERATPLFAASLDASELEDDTPKIAASRHQRRI